MKKKLIKIWGVGLAAVLMLTLVLAAVPVSAGPPLIFATEVLPSPGGLKLGPAGLDIHDFAVASDGTTIYAVGKIAADTSLLYKSTNGGASWTNLSAATGFTIVNTDYVAIAPDDANVVVVLDGTAVAPLAFVSTNGGSSFASMGVIQSGTGVGAVDAWDIDISALSSGVRYVAVAGSAAANFPGVYYFNLGAAAPVWKNACIIAATDFTGAPAAVGSIDSFRAVKFSPNFASDKVLTTVSEDLAAVGGARFHIASFASKTWDAAAGFTGYPVSLEALAVTSVQNAAIGLAPDYLGSDDTMRTAFVGASLTIAAAEAGGIYRLKDVALKDMKAATGFFSVAFDGTNLVAGCTLTNIVWRSADPLASSPTVLPSSSAKRIGVDDVTIATTPDNVTVAWLGADVVGAKIGAAAAFAKSTDNGKTFNSVSLLDSALTTLDDFYVTADGAKQYLLTNDTAEWSLWRYDGSWEVIFCTDTAPTTKYLVRGAPGDSDVLYIADQGGTAMWYSTDAGEHKWSVRAAAAAVQDMAVESADVAYAATGTTVRKSTNGGFTWGTPKQTQVIAGTVHSIKSIAEDQVIVGSTLGAVSYSTDGGATWTKITKALNVALLTQVTASGLDDGEYIYAASSGVSTRVERWQIGTSAAWSNLAAPTTVGIVTYGAYGIELVGGVLYVAVRDVAPTANSAILRTLAPTASVPNAVFWSSIASAGDTFVSAPRTLNISGSTSLWMIDTTLANLVSYSDTLATTPVALIAPADDYQNPMNPVTGRSVDISFSWTKPSNNTTAYDIGVYSDEACTSLIQTSAAFGSTAGSPVRIMGPYQTGVGQGIEFVPGETYYWRVRVNAAGPIESPWSEVRSLSIEPGQALVATISSPANGATSVGLTPGFSWSPIAGATKYEFQLAAGPSGASFANPVASATLADTGHRPVVVLDEDTTYFWRVRAIEPTEGGWSALSNFTTMLTPAAAPPPVVIQQTPAPIINIPAAPPAQQIVIPPAPAPPAQIAPSYIWAIIIIGAILLIVVIVLIFRTRRPV